MIKPTLQPALYQTNPGLNTGLSLESRPDEKRVSDLKPLGLVAKLCRALAEAEINYCHWKSNNALDRSASGDNDLDLLISRAAAPQFTIILQQLGFKQVKAPPDKQMMGVVDYFGYDELADKWVHVHAHYQLVMGHDTTKNFRLPIEQAYLASARQGALFRVPEVEFELIIFVIRMILKHATWDAVLGREGKLNSRERKELAYLQAESKPGRVAELLRTHLPYLDSALFNGCLQALQPGSALLTRLRMGHRLQTCLRTNTRYPLLVDAFLKLWRRADLMIQRRLFKTTANYTPSHGSTAVALVGGDGAGKSTALAGLHEWLAQNFEVTHTHLGKPAWSWLTILVRSFLKMGQLLHLYPLESSFEETVTQKALISPGYPYLIREVCRARDRYHTYVKACRFAAKGGVVLFDRFPLAQIQLMDGPQTARFVDQLMAGPQARQWLSPHKASRFTQALIKLEEGYYQRIALPELVAVLRVPPEIAVQRKPEENPETVRRRSTEIWQANWQASPAHIIDASKPRTEVLAELKALLWSEL